jgi:hypothetical protein
VINFFDGASAAFCVPGKLFADRAAAIARTLEAVWRDGRLLERVAEGLPC